MKTYSPTITDIAHLSNATNWSIVAWWQWGLAGVLTIIAFGIGLAFAPGGLRFDAADPTAERHLVGFSAAEANEREQYRWSERGAALRLFGLTRRQLIVDLRMTSPRPPNAAPAETRFALGSWRSNAFVIGGDWRRYQALLPPRPGATELRLETRTFRPAKESDKRDLGAAFTRVAVYPAGGLPPQIGAIEMLGAMRAAVLLLWPVALFAAISRSGSRVASWIAVAGAAVLVAVAAAHPAEAFTLLPDLWLIPSGAAVGVAIFFGVQPYLTPVLTLMHRVLASDMARLGIVLVVAGVQGLVFLVMVPPWDHPDETAHFEYAWLLAFHPSWPVPGTVNPAISWLSGGRALYHPPTYHLLVSLPLRAAANLDIFSQLYIARSVSLLLFVATVAIIGATVRVITPTGHVLRWLTPLVAALLPSFADAMTAVNNDVGAVAAFSLFLWSAVTIVVRGPNVYRLIWIIVAAALAAAMKNTAFISIGLAPLVCIAAYALHYKWRWRTLLIRALVVVGMLCVAGAPGILAWGDPAGWYRYGEVSPDGAARNQTDLAIDGHYVFRLVAASSSLHTGLSAPIPHHRIPALAGKPVTIGAWVWASRPARIAGPGVLYTQGSDELLNAQQETPLIDVETTPRFFAWTFHTPWALTSLQVFLPALLSDDGDAPVEVFVDNVLLVPGERLPSSPIAGFQSDWKEWYADNLVRNPSAETAWLYLRPWAERAGKPLVRKSPSQILTSLFDINRVILVGLPAIPDAFWRLFASFGHKGDVVFPYQGWVVVLPVLPLIVLLGCVRQYKSLRRDRQRDVAIGLLAVTGLLVWGFAVMRTLPTLVVLMPFFPRYGFPAIAPLALVLAAGWLAWWPVRWRSIGAAALVISLLMLNALAYATMWWHWYV